MRERLLKQIVRHVYATGIHLIFARASQARKSEADFWIDLITQGENTRRSARSVRWSNAAILCIDVDVHHRMADR